MIGSHRTALVTGAGDGLGRAIARMLADEGLRVWATARRTGRLDALAAGSGGRIRPLALTLEDPASIDAAEARAAAEAGGAVDVVVNNAGYGVFGEFESVGAEEWERQVSAMLGGSLRLAHRAWARWRQEGRAGTLVNVSSLAAEFPLPFMSGYNAVKSGLSALSESLMLEARGSPLTVIDFRPGDYRTGFNTAIRPQAQSAVAAGVWRRMDAMLAAAPDPERAAAHLRRALRRNRSGVVRSGSWFQASLAPAAARFLPAGLKRALTARYFQLR
ncbi:MAG TPA: SDR family NAD(P)-dependent oxidoreductase [Opitutaceae bacterium]|jgi:NAD(P)-dependent dehydrogenase (short-subunit alcohol dehydrogenase family)|nr:SDR family NAD(P)-dependent oxidoreductase [Opitutaceae bacterium]